MTLSEEVASLQRAAHDLMYLGMDGSLIYSDDLSRRNNEVYRLTTTLYNYFCREERPEAHKDAYNYVALFAVVVPAAAFPVKFILKIFLINYIDANSVFCSDFLYNYT